ncbi:MAG: hypothetical protein K8W52_27350 [Deltaproteobacteria bacterium]|nr:hypothetical protein [Deltaproteobacteria bacterium]
MATYVIALAEAARPDARAGAKAANLARLIDAGLPVPEGFVLGHDAFTAIVGDLGEIGLDDIGHRFAEAETRALAAALPPELEAAVRDRAAGLGRLAVRSSMGLEDGGAGAGAGVFVSAVDVAPAAVWDAIRAVWVGAFSPLVAAYARHRGAGIDGVGVIVQRFTPGRRVTVYTRAPGSPDDDRVWIERAGSDRVIAARADRDPVVALAIAAERAIGASRGADVELIEGPSALAIVQARPVIHPAPRAPRRPAPLALFGFTRATPAMTWRWDAAHNPAPLSPAQAGLVARVDAVGAATAPLQVVAGYLYYGEAAAATVAPATTASELIARVEDGLARAGSALIAGASLPEAIDQYVAWYRIWARDASAVLSATRRALLAALHDEPDPHRAFAALAAQGTAPVDNLTGALAAASDVSGDRTSAAAALGDWAPAWDVAVPTLAERPAWLHAALASRAARPRAHAPRPSTDPRADLAAAILALAERDDLAFAAAQAHVRRALLVAAAQLGVDPDDIAWLPLDELASAHAAHAIDPISARSRAAGARAAARRAQTWDMPLAVRDGAVVDPPISDGRLRGIGAGPRVVGPVALVDDLGALGDLPPGSIIVVPAVTPALALFAQGAIALVAEHGGALDHGAALARELGIPYVAGVRGALTALRTGDLVVVDGDAGTVQALTPG